MPRKRPPPTKQIDVDLAPAVLGYVCEVPRTTDDVLREFDNDQRAVWACWNMTKRGLMRSEWCDDGRRRWIGLKPAEFARRAAPATANEGGASDGGLALQEAWGIRMSPIAREHA